MKPMSCCFEDLQSFPMRMKHKSQKRTTTENSCSLSLLVCTTTIVGFLLIHQLYNLASQQTKTAAAQSKDIIRRPFLQELEVAEEANIEMPPPRKRSPRAAKRKPRRPPTMIDEFLDESSLIRHAFFPSRKVAIDPAKDSLYYYYPGSVWLDTDGNPIQAHGGGIMYDRTSSTYYWYGEYKDGPTYHSHKKGSARVDVIGVGCYSSKDLWTWKNEGIVLSADDKNETHDLHKSNVLERPKVIYNDGTRKYVMWMHVDDANYTKASVGVAVSDSPTGPFEYLYGKRPHGCESRDMTVFKDDDGRAYLIYSSEENSEIHVGPLRGDYLDVSSAMRRILVGLHREAPAVFKHGGRYYMITSGCTGWAPNEAVFHVSGSMMGGWETVGNPCVGGSEVFRGTTFFSQGTFVLPLPGLPGWFVFMADRWNPGDLRDSRYVWLPLAVRDGVSIYWHRRWRLPPHWKG